MPPASQALDGALNPTTMCLSFIVRYLTVSRSGLRWQVTDRRAKAVSSRLAPSGLGCAADSGTETAQPLSVHSVFVRSANRFWKKTSPSSGTQAPNRKSTSDKTAGTPATLLSISQRQSLLPLTSSGQREPTMAMTDTTPPHRTSKTL